GEGSDCSGAPWTDVASATSFSAGVGIALSGGDGTKMVCVQYADAADNISSAATASITLDAAPSLAFVTAVPDPPNASFAVTATFSEPVTGFGLGAVGVTNGTASNLGGSGTTYTFDVAPTADGAVTVAVGAGAASDAAGNGNTAASSLARTYDGT